MDVAEIQVSPHASMLQSLKLSLRALESGGLMVGVRGVALVQEVLRVAAAAAVAKGTASEDELALSWHPSRPRRRQAAGPRHTVLSEELLLRQTPAS